jgi:hypothetical protein
MGSKNYYEFINSQTGNVIAHLSLSLSLNKEEHSIKLKKRKILLATSHKLNLDLIYWQDRDHPIG